MEIENYGEFANITNKNLTGCTSPSSGVAASNQSDCDALEKSYYKNYSNVSVICLFSPTCSSFQISNKSCDTDSDCTQPQGTAACKATANGTKYCIFDTLAYQAYLQSVHSILGYTFDLQIKKPQLEINFPGLSFSDVSNTLDSEGYIHLPYIGEFIAAVYRYAMAIVSIIAVIVIVMAGAQIIVSGGGEEKAKGYKRIAGAIIGLFIMWGSYFILRTINPALVNFDTIKIQYIMPLAIPSDDTPDNSASPSTTYAGDNLSAKCDLSKLDTDLANKNYFGKKGGNCLGWVRAALTDACGTTPLPTILNNPALGKNGAWDVAANFEKLRRFHSCNLDGIKDGDVVFMLSSAGTNYAGLWTNYRLPDGSKCTVADAANPPMYLVSGSQETYAQPVYNNPTAMPPVTHIGIYYHGLVYNLLGSTDDPQLHDFSVTKLPTLTEPVKHWSGFTVTGLFIGGKSEFVAGYGSMGWPGASGGAGNGQNSAASTANQSVNSVCCSFNNNSQQAEPSAQACTQAGGTPC